MGSTGGDLSACCRLFYRMMGGNLQFKDAFSREHLEKVVWRLLLRNYDHLEGELRFTSGWDRIGPEQFAPQYDQHLRAIRRQVLDDRYTFRPFLCWEADKDLGGTRTVATSGFRDSIVQQALRDVVSPAVEPFLTEGAHAYRSGSSTGCHPAIIQLCRQTRQGQLWVMESDFREFFDSLDHDRLKNLIDALPVDDRAKNLCWRYVRTGAVSMDDRDDEYPASRQSGIVQGGCLSGVLANLYLAEFDREVRKLGGTYLRYADDFVIFFDNEDACHRALDEVQRLAHEAKLDLHPDKTEITHVNEGLEFLGFELQGTRLAIRQQNIEKFRARVEARFATVEARIADGWFDGPQEALKDLIDLINLNITGTRDDGRIQNWIRYFRIANDREQLEDLNRWVWKTIQSWAHAHGLSLQHNELREDFGLRSLVVEYWDMRDELPTADIEYTGWV